MTRYPPSAAPRDRLLPHLIWEAVLAIMVVLLVIVFVIVAPTSTSGRGLQNLVEQVGSAGLIATGLAFSLRTGTPNLAVGALATAAGAIGAQLVATAQWPVLPAMAVGVVVVTIAGAVIGLITGALSMPAWVVTFGFGFIVSTAVLAVSGPVIRPVPIGSAPPGVVWFVLFLLVSLGGAFLWRVPGVRSALSASRTAGEPGRWAGWHAGLGAVAGITVSSLLAGVGGAALTLRIAASSPSSAESFTLAAVAAALLGGASVFGRRAGIAGTVLGVLIIQLVQTILVVLNVESVIAALGTGILLIVGLAAGRLLESVTNSLESRPTPPRPAPTPPPPGPAPAGGDDSPAPRTP